MINPWTAREPRPLLPLTVGIADEQNTLKKYFEFPRVGIEKYILVVYSVDPVFLCIESVRPLCPPSEARRLVRMLNTLYMVLVLCRYRENIARQYRSSRWRSVHGKMSTSVFRMELSSGISLTPPIAALWLRHSYISLLTMCAKTFPKTMNIVFFCCF